MKMIRFSIPVLFILCCSIICFSFVTVDAQGRRAQPDNVQNKIRELEYLVKILKNQLDNSNVKQQYLLKKVEELETKVKTHEKWLPSILDHNARKIPHTHTPTGKIRRTCAEIRSMDLTIPSGMQWIDPDGQGVGETPIYVYCDMTTGSTTINHDSRAPINVGHCAGPGCYSRPIKYEASMAQIKALTELSSECRQPITYDCFNAPHKFENTMYSWWIDRNGNSQNFWAGNNAHGRPNYHPHPYRDPHPHPYRDPHSHLYSDPHSHPHTMPICQCGIDGNCAKSSDMCNCDSLVPQQLSDKGVITSKNILPITRLNFGGTQSPSSSGIHTLGNLTCSGYSRQPKPSTKRAETNTPMPKSCVDLKKMGYTLSGFFSIKGHKMMVSVYCDFSKLPTDAGFQKWIGFIDVKSAPTYFYVQRNQKFDKANTPITFHSAIANAGNAMNLLTGKFKALVKGTYFFSFSGLAFSPGCSNACSSLMFQVKNDFSLQVSLLLNGEEIGFGSVQDSNVVTSNQWSPVTLQSTLNLKKGDTVWVQISYLSSGAYLHDDNFHHTHFTGFMLEEEIVESL